MGACYLIQFPNGKVYVGITTKTASERFLTHCVDASGSRKNRPLHNALRKHGTDSVTVHTLAESEEWATLCAYERMFIALFGSQIRALGYNATSGGDGAPDLSEEAREKMSRSSRKRWTAPEFRERISTAVGIASRELWTDPEYRLKVSTASRASGLQQKPRALAALYASVEDYGEFTAIGVPDPTDFIDRVRAAIHQSPMGYEQLAKVAGMWMGTIRRFATRESHPTDATLRRLADALGVEECEASWPAVQSCPNP